MSAVGVVRRTRRAACVVVHAARSEPIRSIFKTKLLFVTLAASAAFTYATAAAAALHAIVDTSEHKLTFSDGDRAIHSYTVPLGLSGSGKCKAGDELTPIGQSGSGT